MMFGMGDRFSYFECARCECLQIAEIPPDLGRFYPERYYSYALAPRRLSWRRRWIARSGYERRGGVWELFFRGGSMVDLRRLRAMGISRQDRILDVGSGRGQRVLDLRQLGFPHAEGIDPFLEEDSVLDGQVLVRRTALEDAPGGWHLVMLHDSLEHMPDQHAALSQIRRALAPGGKVLVRIPTVSSEPWSLYRECWAGVDAPRHLYLHSRTSFRQLAEAHGFRVASVQDDDMYGYHYWASELFRRGLPLANPAGQGLVRREDAFSRRELAEFRRQALRATSQGRGAEFAAVLVTEG
jgi:SAM-dependent methyltransferase